MDLTRIVLAQVVRFAAASRAAPALVLHGAWLLLVVATWQAGDTSGEAASLTRPFMRATSGATAWAVLVDRVGDVVVARMQPSKDVVPARRGM